MEVVQRNQPATRQLADLPLPPPPQECSHIGGSVMSLQLANCALSCIAVARLALKTRSPCCWVHAEPPFQSPLPYSSWAHWAITEMAWKEAVTRRMGHTIQLIIKILLHWSNLWWAWHKHFHLFHHFREAYSLPLSQTCLSLTFQLHSFKVPDPNQTNSHSPWLGI